MAIEGFGGDLGRDDIRKYVEELKEVMVQLTTQAERIKVSFVAPAITTGRILIVIARAVRWTENRDRPERRA